VWKDLPDNLVVLSGFMWAICHGKWMTLDWCSCSASMAKWLMPELSMTENLGVSGDLIL